MRVKVSKSTRAGKKYMAAIEDGPTVHFGATGYEDYTQHGDEKRKASYLARHEARETWTLQGVGSAGFWGALALVEQEVTSRQHKRRQQAFHFSVCADVR